MEQQAWLKYLEMRRQEPISDILGYVRAVITNLIYASWTERGRRRAELQAFWEYLQQTADAPQSKPPFDSPAEQPMEMLLAAIQRLSPSLRRTIELDMRGLKNQEIASELGITVEA